MLAGVAWTSYGWHMPVASTSGKPAAPLGCTPRLVGTGSTLIEGRQL